MTVDSVLVIGSVVPKFMMAAGIAKLLLLASKSSPTGGTVVVVPRIFAEICVNVQDCAPVVKVKPAHAPAGFPAPTGGEKRKVALVASAVFARVEIVGVCANAAAAVPAKTSAARERAILEIRVFIFGEIVNGFKAEGLRVLIQGIPAATRIATAT